MRRGLLERTLLVVIGLGFALGMTVHALDFWWFGWAPYLFGPPALNAFWNALVVLDALVVVLLVTGWTRCALAVALAVMIGDVSANSYAWNVLGLTQFAPALVAQSGLLGLLLGSTGFLWRRTEPVWKLAKERVSGGASPLPLPTTHSVS